MKSLVRAPRDFGAGALMIGVGAAFLWLAADLKIGSSRSMGPGYVPVLLATGLVVVGFALVALSLVRSGPPVETPAVRELATITLALATFALMYRGAGLILSIMGLVAISAFAEKEIRPIRIVATAIVLSLFSWLVFTVLLGIPMRPFGTWFGD